MHRIFSVLVSMILVVGAVLAEPTSPEPDPEMLKMLPMFEQMGSPGQYQLLAQNRPPAPEQKRSGKPQAGMRHKSRMGKMGGRIELLFRLREELDLSEEQVEKMKSIKLESEKNLIRKKADKDIAQVELREIMSKEDIDFSKAKSKLKELNQLNGTIMLANVESLEKTYNVLTKEQKEKLKSIRKEKKEMRKKKSREKPGKKKQMKQKQMRQKKLRK